MRKARFSIIVAVIAALVLIFAFVGYLTIGRREFKKQTDKVESFTLVVLGEPGQTFNVLLDSDGNDRKLSGVTPSEFPLKACVLNGTITKVRGDGTLRLRVITEDQKELNFGQLVEPGTTRRFRYHAKGFDIWPVSSRHAVK